MNPTGPILAAVALVAGMSGGVALGRYATGGEPAATASTERYADAFPQESFAPREPEPAIARDLAPEDYVCKGCGPTLAERRLYSYDDGLGDLPRYRPATFEDDRPFRYTPETSW